MARQRGRRKRPQGSSDRPRLVVSRGIRSIQAQVVNDDEGRSLCGSTSLANDLKVEGDGKGKLAAAKAVGEEVGRRAIELGVTTIVFDRNGYKYHGRVRALAEGARAAGLKF